MDTKKVLHIRDDHPYAHEFMSLAIPEYRTNLYQVTYVDVDYSIRDVDSIEKFCTKYTQLTNLHLFDIILFLILTSTTNFPIYVTSGLIEDIKQIYRENNKQLPKFACVNFSGLNDDLLKQQQQLFPDFFVDYRKKPVNHFIFEQRWNEFVNA
ncbi:MAG: hypothetical protein GY797_19340 [Deltaproteobacteria bacterium]|nr:hypothetical protein [Deltaproteobacteria bacterium]